MSAPKAHLSFQWAEFNRLDRQLGLMRRWGVSESDLGFQALFRARGAAFAKVGLMRPRISTLILKLLALSPGEIKLFADAELGWLTEARSKPGATPVYKYVSDEVAETIVKGKLTHELEEFLMTPDDYIGE